MSEEMKRVPVIVCVGQPGRAVVYGWVDGDPVPGEAVTLHRARMVLYWPTECGGLFGLAASGPRSGLRLTHSVEQTTARVWSECLSVSPGAAAALDGWTGE